MFDIRALALSVRPSGEGFWVSPSPSTVSYPSDGNDVYFGLEDVSFWFRHRNRAILEAVRNFPPEGGAILDVGGGNGYVTAALQNAGFDAILIEPNERGARNAVRRGVTNVICGAIETIGLVPSGVGAIALFDVIEHIEDDHGFLKGLAAHLRPGTRIYVTVPAFGALWSSDDDAAGHFRRYRRSAIEHVLRSAGFAIEYSTCFFSFVPLPILLFRVLPSRLGLRPRPTEAQIASEHQSFAANAAEKALAWEISLIRRRKSVPMGSSCLVVGKLAEK